MTDSNYTQNVFDLVSEEHSEEDAPQNDEVTLSSGVTFRVKKVPPLYVDRINVKFPEPRPREYWNPDKERNEINPMHPEYIAEKEAVAAARGNALVDVFLGLGTEIVIVPAGFPKLEDTSWVEDVEFFLGETLDPRPRARYLAWVRYVAIQSAEDLTRLSSKIMGKMGVAESEVEEAINNRFPRV